MTDLAARWKENFQLAEMVADQWKVSAKHWKEAAGLWEQSAARWRGLALFSMSLSLVLTILFGGCLFGWFLQ